MSCVRMDVEAWTSKIRMFLENIPDPVQVKPVQVLSGRFFFLKQFSIYDIGLLFYYKVRILNTQLRSDGLVC